MCHRRYRPEGAKGLLKDGGTKRRQVVEAAIKASGGKLEAGTCPFACTTTSIGNTKKFKAHASVTDAYANIVSNLGGANKAKVEQTAGKGVLAGNTALTIPAAGLAECATIVEYTSPAATASEAILKLKVEVGTTYTEAEAKVKY